MKNFKMKKTPIANAIGCVLAIASLNLHAQEASEGVDEGAEMVVVTGSLIRRDGFSSEQPVEIIKAEDAAAQGIKNIGELLRQVTVAAGSPQVTSASGVDFVNNGGEGAETLSLRGLGANRTLVLLNGRRAGPAGTRGGTSSFDFNVLPIAMVDRIEILKDGASSLYGSDAVAGVVNIITKKGEGGEINAFMSKPEDSGGENNRLSATWGMASDHGSMRIVADYNKQSELARGDRSYLNCARRNIYDATTGELADPIDPRTGKAHCNDTVWGHVWIYDYQDGGNVPAGALAQYDYDGSLAAAGLTPFPNTFDPNNPDLMVTPPGWFPVRYDRESDALTNADHPFQDQMSLQPEVERMTLYFQGDMDFGSGLNGYSEVLLNRRTTKTNSYRQFWQYTYNENFFGANPLSAGWQGAQYFSPLAITDHNDSKIEVDYKRIVLGLKGDIGDWYWDASYQFSRSDGKYTTDEIFADAIDDQRFATGSCLGQFTSVRGVNCIDVPWLDPQFLAGNISAADRAFLFGRQTGKTIYEQASVDFVISGDLFELPSGAVGLAAGVHYRTDEIDDTPGSITLASNGWGTSAAGITAGDDTTTAYFFEAKIPIASGLPGIKNMELSVSDRFTDVDSSGNANTYKIGLNWEIGAGFRLRASKGTSFRAPALFELYLADQRDFSGQLAIDPCIRWEENLEAGNIPQRVADNCAADGLPGDFAGGAASAEIVTGGGKGILESETSESKTYGLIWQTEDADFSVSIDYFDFLIEGEVTQLGAANIVFQCYNSENFGSDPLCNQFDRTTPQDQPNDQRITEVRDQFINIAKQSNRGVDFAIDYRTETGLGNLILQTRYTRQIESAQEIFADTETDSNGEFGDPEKVGSFTAVLESGDWTYNWGMQYIGAVSDEEKEGGSASVYRGQAVTRKLSADSVSYHSFSVSHTFAETGFEATVGVANAFDKRPPKISTYRNSINNVGDSAFYSQYDFLGRRFFADVTYRFK